MVIEATGKRKSGPVMAAKPKKMKYKHRAAGLKEKDTADGTVVTGTSLIDTQLGQLVAEAKSCQPKRSVVKRCLKEIRYALAAQPAADVGIEALDGAAFAAISVRDAATRLAWQPPAAVALIGSIASGTAVSTGEVHGGTYANNRSQVQNVDLAVQMPRSCFLAKDHLNSKYSDKRAIYLAVMLRTLRGTQVYSALVRAAHTCALKFGTARIAALRSRQGWVPAPWGHFQTNHHRRTGRQQVLPRHDPTMCHAHPFYLI